MYKKMLFMTLKTYLTSWKAGTNMKKNKFSKIISSNECLYRYRSVNEENIKALSSGRLYFSKVGNFNDPYDS